MKSNIIKLLLFFFLFFPLTLWADQLIIEPEMGRQPIFDAIAESKQTINLVMYGFTDQALLNALLQKKKLTLKIILENHPYKRENENDKVINLLNKNNISWQGTIPGIDLIHQKTLLIDQQKAIVMTFNFTRSAFKNDRNFALILDNPKQVKEIANIFSADWNHVPISSQDETLIYSPMSRAQIIQFIHSAKKSIDIYAQNISDYQLIGTIAKTARRGINIRILTSQSFRLKQRRYLEKAGVIIHRSTKYYIHAKTMIIDQQKALIGSTNLTPSSLDRNRELSTITQDNKVISQLNSIFEEDWNNSKQE